MAGPAVQDECLKGCRIHGCTACEWDQDDGECWAYIKKIRTSPGPSSNTLCHMFQHPEYELENPKIGKQGVQWYYLLVYTTYAPFIDCPHAKFGEVMNMKASSAKAKSISHRK